MKVNLLGQAVSAEHANQTVLYLPLYFSKVSAGFPSPAQDYIEQTIVLNKLCIKHPHKTFLCASKGIR